MTSKFLIYALSDPRNPDMVRYIGMSSSGLNRPKRHHTEMNHHFHLHRWLRKMRADGVRARIEVLEEFQTASDLPHAEMFWIAQGKGLGWKLTNSTNGGDGLNGFRFSEATKAKMSASAKGRPKSDAHKEAIRQARLGTKASPAARENMRLARIEKLKDPVERQRVATLRLGATNKPESIEKTRAALLGRKHSLEHREENRLGHLGLKDSEATRAKKSRALTGRPVSFETRKKMSDAHLRRCSAEPILDELVD